ncbi:MAG: RNA methyltransferase [Nanoarchaeota archaeon]|nr:RNA methyltransferase [Nanoarchaeota archaeon]
MKRGFSSIGLYNPKFHENVGSVLRAAGCYDVSMVAISGIRYKNSKLDTRKQYRHTPLIHTKNLLDTIPLGATPIAVDLVQKAKSIVNYVHPESAFYIFGPEDGTLDDDIINQCKDVIYIPTNGCMNLAATVNVVLYDRMVKQK